MTRLAAALTAPLLLALLVAPRAANAACYTCAEIRSATQSVMDRAEDNINDHTTDEHEQLREGIAEMTEQISRILLKQIETEEAMRTAEQNQRVRREREKLELEAKQVFLRQPRSACVTTSALRHVPQGQVLRNTFQQQLSAAAMAYDTNATAATAGTEGVAASARLAHREERYCSEIDAERGLCTTPVDVRLQDADLKAATLLDHGTLDPELNQAAQDFCHNFIRPVPPRPLNAATSRTPAGEITLIRRANFDARISVARQICSHLIAQQTETLDLKAWAEAVELDVESLNPEAEGISIHDFMRIEIQRRYGNPGWVTETLGRDGLPVNLDKELAMMMGLRLYLDWERFKIMRLMALASGSLVAADAGNDFYQGGSTSGSLDPSLISDGR